MMKHMCFAFLLFSNLFFSQAKDSISMLTTATKLNPTEFEFAKAEYSKMIKTEDYKRTRHMAAVIEVKVNYNRVPMSSDAELTKWLTDNLNATNLKSVEEGLLCIRPYVILKNKLIQEYLHVYELIGKASFAQVSEIMEPEFHLTEEDLKLSE